MSPGNHTGAKRFKHMQNDLSAFEQLRAVVSRRAPLIVFLAVPILVFGTFLVFGLDSQYDSFARFRLAAGAVADTTGRADELEDEYVYGLFERVVAEENLKNILLKTQALPPTGILSDYQNISDLRNSIRLEMLTQTVLDSGGGRERAVNTGFEVRVRRSDAKAAAEIASHVADSFVAISRSERKAAAMRRINFFSAENERLKQNIFVLEKQLADFKSQNFSMLPEALQANTIVKGRYEQELENVEREIRTLRQNRVFIVDQLRLAKSGQAAGNLQQLEGEYARKAATYSENHPDLVSLRRQIGLLRASGGPVSGGGQAAIIAAKEAELVEALQRYQPEHPDVRRLEREIELLRAEQPSLRTGELFQAETLASVQLQTQLNALDTQLQGLLSRAGQLSGSIRNMELQLSSTPEIERQASSIARELETARDQFRQMLDERMKTEVGLAAIDSGSADRFSLVAAPEIDTERSFPNYPAFILIVLIIATIISTSVAAIAEGFDTKVRSADEIEEIFGVGPLASVPKIKNSVATRARRVTLVSFAIIGFICAPIGYVVAQFVIN